MHLKNSKIIVIKIGSSLLVDNTKKIRKKWLSSFAKDIKKLKLRNKKIIIVSSGAIALGCKKMRISLLHFLRVFFDMDMIKKQIIIFYCLLVLSYIF